jgi:hypothetical protein
MIKSAVFIISILSFPAHTLAQDGGSGGGGGLGSGSGGAIENGSPLPGENSAQRLGDLNDIDRALNDLKRSTTKARPKFATLFDKTQNAILKDDLKKADELVLKLREMKPVNDYEQSRLYLIDYWYYGKQGNKELENDAASKLLSIGAGNIDSQAFVEAGMRLLKRQFNNQDIGGAIETLTNLRKEPSSQVELMSVVSAVKKLDDYAEQKTNIVQKITTNETGNWSAKLFKSHFLFSGISGEISTLEFNCINKQSTLTYKSDSVMEIPEAWGSCAMRVNAKPNTSFTLTQLQQKPM